MGRDTWVTSPLLPSSSFPSICHLSNVYRVTVISLPRSFSTRTASRLTRTPGGTPCEEPPPNIRVPVPRARPPGSAAFRGGTWASQSPLRSLGSSFCKGAAEGVQQEEGADRVSVQEQEEVLEAFRRRVSAQPPSSTLGRQGASGDVEMHGVPVRPENVFCKHRNLHCACSRHPPPAPLSVGSTSEGSTNSGSKMSGGGGWGLWSDLRDAGRPGRAASSAWSTCRLRFLLTVPCALGLTTTCTALHRIRCHQQSSEDSRQAGESRPCVGDAHPWVSVATWPQNLPRGCWGTTPSSRAGPRHLAFGLVSPAEM